MADTCASPMSRKSGVGLAAVSAENSGIEFLTDLYNATRIDYPVPMPMTVADMERYIRHYDVDLGASVVAVDGGEPVGLGMLGLRAGRSWITRLGVLPRRRGQGAGSFLVSALLDRTRERGIEQVELEAVEENRAARKLFARFGFREVRALSVLSRAPGKPKRKPSLSGKVSRLGRERALEKLGELPGDASWVTASESLVKMKRLRGLEFVGPGSDRAWLIFGVGSRTLGPVVFGSGARRPGRIGWELLRRLHRDYPGKDTAVENVPRDHPLWSSFQRMGYLEAFRRIEMRLDLRRCTTGARARGGAS